MGEATLCWTASSSDVSLADMLPSTCWAQTGRTPLWQFSQARPEPKLSVDHFSHKPQLGGTAPGVVVACACCACVTARWPWELLMCGNAIGFLLRLRCLRPSVMNRIAVYRKPA